MDSIESEFKERAVVRGGIHFFKPEDALDVIRMCQEQNKKILGIDAFIIQENKTQPVLEHSIDYSTNGVNQGNWSEATLFIEDRRSYNFMFEIIYE